MIKPVYAGIDKDSKVGLTLLGRMVLDAWVFGILPETQTCEGWDAALMQNLYEKVYAAWQPYAHLPSRLPEELRIKHAKFYDTAINAARKDGWDPELGDDE